MSTRWSGGRLIAASAILTCAGTLLLYAGLQPSGLAPAAAGGAVPVPVVTAASPTATATTSPGPRASRSGGAAPGVPVPSGAAASVTAPPADRAAVQAELPHPGSGEAADPLIQQALDRASPADLPGRDEALLLRQGREAWLAETGAYTRVRIQAATARRETAGGEKPVRAVVRLVWAGADRAGAFLDGRPAAIHFTQNGNGSWNRTH
ncbi:hypothetical protein [Streptomyces sp. NPDC089799]|uniref:hypothetical protein n=1 Tax=Streptomyces sp. NPDC089799 TaxID=3155066 RepID=UPI0034478463